MADKTILDLDAASSVSGDEWVELSTGERGKLSDIVVLAGGASRFGSAPIASGAIDLSDETVSVWRVALTGNVTTITLPTALTGQALAIIVVFTQDGTGGRTVAGWPSTTWESGAAPSISSAAGAVTSVPLLVFGDGTVLGVN